MNDNIHTPQHTNTTHTSHDDVQAVPEQLGQHRRAPHGMHVHPSIQGEFFPNQSARGGRGGVLLIAVTTHFTVFLVEVGDTTTGSESRPLTITRASVAAVLAGEGEVGVFSVRHLFGQT